MICRGKEFYSNILKCEIFHRFFPELQLPNWISANHCKYLHLHSKQGQRQHLPTKVPHILFEDVSNCNPCRLDFETFSGLATSALGTCSDSLAVVGMSGYNPPTICGTNTGYHSKTYVCFVFVCLGLFVSVDTTLQPFVAPTLNTTVRLIFVFFVFVSADMTPPPFLGPKLDHKISISFDSNL